MDQNLKPKLEGPSVVCQNHKNQRITTYCKKCKSYLCFECQMDHIDHAKGNFENAVEELLFEKIKNDRDDIKKAIINL